MKNHNERAHSTLGASSTYRWMNCPGSVRLCEGVPNRTSSYAEEGTMAHELLEHCLKNDVDPFDVKKFKKKEVPEDMKEAVSEAIEHIKTYLGGGKTLSIEERFSLEWLYPGMFGTNDICIREDFGDLHIMDYKHGKGVAVDVENNPQLLFYAIGAAYNSDLSDFEDYERVFLHIIQPRAYHLDGPIRVWETSIEHLREFSEILRQKAIETTKKDAALIPGENQCRFCDAKSFCPAIYKDSVTVAQNDFTEVETLSPEHLTLDQIGKVVVKEKVVSEFLKACKERALEALKNGQTIQGLKLVNKRSKRIWNKEDEEMEEILTSLHDTLNPANVTETKLKTVSKIEKIIGKKNASLLDDHVSTIQGDLDVAPESDRRKPAKVEAALDFDEI